MPRNARPWFRIFSEALDSRKLQRLRPPLKWTWFNLMCLANITRPRGALPDLIEIAYRLRTTERLAEVDLRDLKAAGLIDDKDGVLFMHDWDEWQKESDVRASSVPDSGPVAAPLRPATTDIPPPKRRNSVPLEESRGDQKRKEERRSRAPVGGGPLPFEPETAKTGRTPKRLLTDADVAALADDFPNLDVTYEAVKFRDYLAASRPKWIDHVAAFRNWLRRAQDDKRPNKANGTSASQRPAAEHLGEPGPEPPKRIFIDRFTGEPI